MTLPARSIRLLDAITNVALSHDEHCECVVCRAAAGDKDAMAEVLSAAMRQRGGA